MQNAKFRLGNLTQAHNMLTKTML
uniref:Uncharacterized protein n=1 Tax=Anguilla anguilla TaxID=7936 RepID=A0A0E9PHT8_ANGAN